MMGFLQEKKRQNIPADTIKDGIGRGRKKEKNFTPSSACSRPCGSFSSKRSGWYSMDRLNAQAVTSFLSSFLFLSLLLLYIHVYTLRRPGQFPFSFSFLLCQTYPILSTSLCLKPAAHPTEIVEETPSIGPVKKREMTTGTRS